MNGAGLLAHLSKENPGELTLTVKNSSSVLYRGTVDALPAVDPNDLNGSAIHAIFPQIVTSGSNPTVNDDVDDGYGVGTLWVNTTSDSYFILSDSTAGSAVWAASLPLAGGTLTGEIAMGANKITGLANGTSSGDAINKGQLDGLIDSAPEALDTLNELAAALGDDVNFSTTVATNIATKLPLAGGTLTGALTIDGSLKLKEQADADADTAAYGQLWIKTATPNQLWFTNDAGTDTQLDTPGSPWAESGDDIHYSDGKVGVGKVPAQELDVLGDIQASAYLYANGGAFRFNLGDIYYGSGIQLQYFNASTLAITTGLELKQTGFVGINTTAPSSLLDVRGDAGAAGVLTLSTAELTVVDGNELGRINFQAPLETGEDAILVAASIYAEANDTFAADNNTTDLVFSTAASETAAEKMRLTSAGELLLKTGATYNAPVFRLDTYPTGMNMFGNTKVGMISNGVGVAVFQNSLSVGMMMKATMPITWSTADINGGADLLLFREAAGILAQRNNGAVQEFRIYSDLGDPAGNYERGSFAMDTSGDLTIATEAGGTGTVGKINLDGTVVVDGTVQLKVYTVGALPSGSPSGQRAFVSDSYYGFTYAYIGSVVSPAGSNFVPVYSDGTYWKIG